MRYHNGRPLNRDNGMGAFMAQGLAGGQSGEGVRRVDNMLAQQPVDIGAFSPGMTGAQSGPVEEGWPLMLERGLQGVSGLGLGVGGAATGGVLGMGLGELVGGLPGAVVGGSAGIQAGMIPGAVVMKNSEEPKPDDVWAHKLDQFIRRKWRGLD